MRLDETSGVTEQRGGSPEHSLTGLGVSPGIAIGPIHIGERGDLPVRERHIPEAEVESERCRFSDAVAVSLNQLRKLKTKAAGLPESAAEEVGYLLDAHLAMLSNSRLVRGADQRISRTRINAERAVQIEIDEIAESFARMRDSYLAARIEDIRVVGTRLIRNLIKKPFATYSAMPEGAVILAEELTPADTALIDPQRVAAFATVFGGAESHTAIVARALGLPAVLAVPGLLERAQEGSMAVIDGTEARYLNSGNAALTGVLAATLAAGGIVGGDRLLDGKFGTFMAHIQDEGAIDASRSTDRLGETWRLLGIVTKPYPTAFVTHEFIDAILAAVADDVDHDRILAIHCAIPAAAANLVLEPLPAKREPQTASAAKVALPHILAEAAVYRDIGAASFTPDRLTDPRVRTLAAKVTYEVRDSTPAASGAITVQRSSGVRIDKPVRRRPMNEARIVEKFMKNATPALGPDGAQALLNATLELGRSDEIDPIILET